MKKSLLFLFVLSNFLLGFFTPAYAVGNKPKNEAGEKPNVASVLDQRIVETLQLLEPSNKGCLKSIKPAEDILSQMIVKNYNKEVVSGFALTAVVCAFSYDDFEATIRISETGIPYSVGEIKDYMLIGSILSSYYAQKDEKIFSFIEEIDPNNTTIMNLIEAEVWKGFSRAASHTKEPEKNRYMILKLIHDKDLIGFTAGDKIDFTNQYIYSTILLDTKNPELEGLIFNITDPDLYLNILVDKRFDFIKSYKKYDEFANIKTQFLRMETYINSQMVDNPKELALINTLSHIQRYLGRSNEVLIMLNKTIAKTISDPDYFIDSDAQLNWINEQKARSLMAQGKTKDGLIVLEKAIKIKEHGYDNISQAINYAATSVDYGYYDQAKNTLTKATKERSKYADVLVLTIEGCARYKTYDKKFDLVKIEKELSSFEDFDLGMSLVSFYACMGDVDNVSKTILKLLDNPEYRAETLVNISATLSPGEYLSNQKTETNEVIKQALKNEDVLNAINKYGYIITIPLDKNLIGF